MKHTFYLLLLGAWLASPLVVAQGVMTFQTDDHNFGDLREGAQAEQEFVFTNTGNQPVVVSSVRASCGCTTPYWTKEPIMPGQQGKIKASYNSQGRPGSFYKTITVVSNAAQPTTVLKIRGNVTNAPAHTAAELAASPRVQLEQPRLTMGKVEMGQHATRTFKLTNTGKGTLEINGHRSTCNCVTLEPAQRTVAPGASTQVKVTYAPRYNAPETVMIQTNDLANPETELILEVEVVSSVSKNPGLMREDKAAVPFK